MRRISTFAAVAFLALASVAHAEDIDFWNFRGQMPRETKVNGLTNVETIDEGLRVQTTTDGLLVWPALTAPAEVLSIRARVNRPLDVSFVWQPTTAEQGLYQIPFTLQNGKTDVILSDYASWDPQAEAIGIAFKAGSEVVIEEMEFRHWTPMERLIEGWKSFWTFDEFRAYSINFLWGPLVTGNSPARMMMFENLPPFAWSITRYFYGALIITGIIALIIGFIFKRRALGLGIFATVFVCLWLLFDVRMGAEILSYVKDDISTYVTKEGGEQTLRTHGNMYAVLNDMLPSIREEEKFMLMFVGGSPFYPNLRYMAYPSVAVLDGQDRTGVKLWAIFDRPDFSIDAQGRLVRTADPSIFPGGREVLTGTGKMVLDYGAGTFLFKEL